MPVSDAHKKASAKWNSSRDNIMLRPDKETGAAIRAAAKAAGLSVQQFILRAITEFMDSKRVYEKTPSGGDYSEIYYLNDEHKEVPQEEATQFIIRECKKDGTLVTETYGRTKNG